MKRVLLIVLLISFCLLPYAQNKKQRKLNGKATTTKVAKSKIIKNTVYTNSSIRGLQNQRAAIQKKIREQEAELRANKENVKQRLQNLLVINSEIDQKQKSIDGIQSDIHHIEGNIGILKSQLKTLEQQLQDRKAKYIKSMRYMSRHHSVQCKSLRREKDLLERRLQTDQMVQLRKISRIQHCIKECPIKSIGCTVQSSLRRRCQVFKRRRFSFSE
jgi:chromosome segregation ATPase